MPGDWSHWVLVATFVVASLALLGFWLAVRYEDKASRRRSSMRKRYPALSVRVLPDFIEPYDQDANRE